MSDGTPPASSSGAEPTPPVDQSDQLLPSARRGYRQVSQVLAGDADAAPRDRGYHLRHDACPTPTAC